MTSPDRLQERMKSAARNLERLQASIDDISQRQQANEAEIVQSLAVADRLKAAAVRCENEARSLV